MKKIITMMLILTFAVGICLAQTYIVWEENFDSSTNVPNGWDDISNESAEVVAGIGVGGTNALKFHAWYASGMDYNDWDICTPLTPELPADATLSFDYRIMEPGSTTTAGDMGSTTFVILAWDSEFDGYEIVGFINDHTSSASYRTITMSLEDFEGDSWYINIIVETGEIGENYDVHLDNVKITAPTPEDYDLKVLSFTGPGRANLAETSEYIVVVKNAGALSVDGEDYTVSLMMVGSDTAIGTEDGVNLVAGATEEFSFTWTPDTTGNFQLYAVIDYEDDLAEGNNTSDNLDVTVLDPSSYVYIGDDTSTTGSYAFPFNYYYYQSIVQSIYLESELTDGLITTIGYKFSRSASNYPPDDIPVKIWMANTNKNFFANTQTDFVPYADFQLVYEGPLPVNIAGINDIAINLDTPFMYDSASADGANLVIMTQKHRAVEYASSNMWQVTDQGSGRTYFYQADTPNITNIATAYPTSNITRSTDVPNTMLVIESGPFVTLTGAVTDDVSSDGITGVKIAIDGSSRFVMSGANGAYTFPYFPVGTDIAITASKHGYYDAEEEVTTVENQANVFPIVMTAIPTVTVTGTILASDTATTGIEGVTVTLTGYDDYTATTQAGGIFSIPNVYVDQTYTITVTAPRYITHTANDIEITSASHAIPTITLTERRNPPQNVVATPVATGMSIAWALPSTTAPVPLRSIAEVTSNDSESHTRALTGYNIYRTTLANQANEANWVEVITNTQASPYVDTAWLTMEQGDYKYAIKAIYTGNLLSDAAFSNTVVIGATVTVEVSTSDEAPATGAIVRLVNNNNNPDMIYQATVTANDMATLENVSFGSYTVTVSLAGYNTYSDADIAIGSNPYNLSATLSRVYVLLSESFDGLSMPAGWSATANNSTYPWQFREETHSWHSQTGEEMYYLPHSGAGMAASQSYDGEDGGAGALSPDNWLITPQLFIASTSVNPRLEYYVATYTWRDYMSVCVSTTGTAPANFVQKSREQVPSGGPSGQENWVMRTLDLTEYAGQSIYIAFRHYNSADQFWLMLDDVTVYAQGNVVGIGDETTPIAQTALHTNYPNPFNPTTTISFDVARESNVSIDVYNIKGQKVKTLTNEVFGVGSHYVVWNGDDHNGRNVSSGVYFYRMTTEGYTKTQKMLLMK